MKKLCIHLSEEEHARIKAKAAMSGLSLLEVGKQLFLAWERGVIRLSDKEENDTPFNKGWTDETGKIHFDFLDGD